MFQAEGMPQFMRHPYDIAVAKLARSTVCIELRSDPREPQLVPLVGGDAFGGRIPSWTGNFRRQRTVLLYHLLQEDNLPNTRHCNPCLGIIPHVQRIAFNALGSTDTRWPLLPIACIWDNVHGRVGRHGRFPELDGCKDDGVEGGVVFDGGEAVAERLDSRSGCGPGAGCQVSAEGVEDEGHAEGADCGVGGGVWKGAGGDKGKDGGEEREDDEGDHCVRLGIRQCRLANAEAIYLVDDTMKLGLMYLLSLSLIL